MVGGSLAWALRQPLILGYVFGGLLISPFTPGPSVSDPRSFDLFAEIGVVKAHSTGAALDLFTPTYYAI